VTCEHCGKLISAERGYEPARVEYRDRQGRIVLDPNRAAMTTVRPAVSHPAKYCSDHCRRRASEARIQPYCTACGVVQVSHKSKGLCGECAREVGTVWTRERIIDAIQDYATEYGRPPSAREWNPQMAVATYRDDIAERFYEDGCWPSATTVQKVFGRWNAAIEAAGFTPLRPGAKYVDMKEAS
jgi:hypothetical protein